jgi:hypothetical protein
MHLPVFCSVLRRIEMANEAAEEVGENERGEVYGLREASDDELFVVE